MRARPDLDQIVGFLAVAEELNFRRAAERLSLDQSALSRRIKALEDRLGFLLVFRTTHAVRLTEAGRAFYEANRDVLGGIDAAVERARRVALGASGRLRVASMTFAAVEIMPAAVRLFVAQHPDVALELEYRPTLAQKLALARGDIDVGLMLGPLDHADFATLPLGLQPLVAVMAETHALAAKASLEPAEVAAEPMVLGHPSSWDFYRSRIDEIFALQGQRLSVAFEAPDLVGILGLVRTGLGITVLPQAMQRFAPAGLVTREIARLEGGIATVAAWRRPAEGNVSAFVACLRKVRGPARAG
jgi:LysR family transcriptional regulator, benzoate and cis,cis-muconate-responsive activator of ben and cat genes